MGDLDQFIRLFGKILDTYISNSNMNKILEFHPKINFKKCFHNVIIELEPITITK